MKTLQLIFFCLFTSFTFSQSNTEVFLFDLEINYSNIGIKNGKNISNNVGYDNQPSFLDDRYIVFASTRNEQTDVVKYDSRFNSKIWINSTDGGEYTPLKIPNNNAVSAVRLDKDGKQRLYRYDLGNATSTELIKDLVVAYYTWYNEEIIVSAVIEGEQLNLVSTNIKTGVNKILASNVGRSLHKIPNSNLVSFISKANQKQWQIKSINPLTGKIKLIANTISGVEDICWLNKKNLLSGNKSILYKLTLKKDNNWKKVANLNDFGIVTVTRLATNKSGTKLVLVGAMETNYESSIITNQISEEEDNASKIVQKHIDPFNNRELDKFADAFNDNIKVNRYPEEHLYTGRMALKQNYKDFFDKNEKSNVKVLSRINLNNVVIDEELVTINNSTKRQVTIYEVDANGINSMTFIDNSKMKRKAESVVNEKLKKFNEKDIKAFGRTYAKNVEVYSFPNFIKTDSRSDLREGYIKLFENTPDLYLEIVNRIIIGNKVIDKEKMIVNGEITYCISIYEIENSLIKRVTTIQ
mgnify:CR=1 FL=1